MPQPLTRVRSVSATTWGAAALEQRPQLAALIMECIATWSQTEISLGSLLARILQFESAFAAVQMYLRLTSAEARRSVLDAAAKSMLAPEDYQLFVLVMKAIKPVRDRRNDFAHGVWGTAGEIPDGLLWVSSDARLAYDAALAGATPKNLENLGLLGPVIRAMTEHNEAIMVYRLPDLKGDVRNAREAALATSYLTSAFKPIDEERDVMRQELYRLRLIGGVTQSESTDVDTPSPQQQPPPETPNGTA